MTEKARGRKPAKDIIVFGGKKLYSLNAIADTFGISVSSLRGYIADGRMKAAKIAGRFYVTEENVLMSFYPESDDRDPNKKNGEPNS